jgi:hypothetical protein
VNARPERQAASALSLTPYFRALLLGVLKGCESCTSVPVRITALVKLGDLFVLTNPGQAGVMYKKARGFAEGLGWEVDGIDGKIMEVEMI